jgi:hypothetical protein
VTGLTKGIKKTVVDDETRKLIIYLLTDFVTKISAGYCNQKGSQILNTTLK